MERLINLSNEKEKYVYGNPVEYDQYSVEMGEDVLYSLRRQYVNREKDEVTIRLSSLGKSSAFELLGKKLGLVKKGGAYSVNEQLRTIFTLGDWFEAFTVFSLKRIGYQVLKREDEVNWHGIKGHTDAYIQDEFGEKHLLEIKSANDWYFTQCKRRGYPGDERGYLTQLLTYTDATEFDREHAHWVMWNKNTSELLVMPLTNVPEEYANERLNRAKQVAKAFANCNNKHDLYSSVQPVPPKIEKTRDCHPVLDEDGNYKLYVPPSVSFPEFSYVLKEGRTRYGKKRMYVEDYNYPEEFKQYKPNVLEMALAFDRR